MFSDTRQEEGKKGTEREDHQTRTDSCLNTDWPHCLVRGSFVQIAVSYFLMWTRLVVQLIQVYSYVSYITVIWLLILPIIRRFSILRSRLFASSCSSFSLTICLLSLNNVSYASTISLFLWVISFSASFPSFDSGWLLRVKMLVTASSCLMPSLVSHVLPDDADRFSLALCILKSLRAARLLMMPCLIILFLLRMSLWWISLRKRAAEATSLRIASSITRSDMRLRSDDRLSIPPPLSGSTVSLLMLFQWFTSLESGYQIAWSDDRMPGNWRLIFRSIIWVSCSNRRTSHSLYPNSRAKFSSFSRLNCNNLWSRVPINRIPDFGSKVLLLLRLTCNKRILSLRASTIRWSVDRLSGSRVHDDCCSDSRSCSSSSTSGWQSFPTPFKSLIEVANLRDLLHPSWSVDERAWGVWVQQRLQQRMIRWASVTDAGWSVVMREVIFFFLSSVRLILLSLRQQQEEEMHEQHEDEADGDGEEGRSPEERMAGEIIEKQEEEERGERGSDDDEDDCCCRCFGCRDPKEDCCWPHEPLLLFPSSSSPSSSWSAAPAHDEALAFESWICRWL